MNAAVTGLVLQCVCVTTDINVTTGAANTVELSQSGPPEYKLY